MYQDPSYEAPDGFRSTDCIMRGTVASEVSLPPPLLHLKPVIPELQRVAVLRHGPHDVIRRTVRNVGMDLQCDFHLGAH